MLSHDAGVSLLASGGSIVTRLSPDKKDWSAVIEKMSTSNSICECRNATVARAVTVAGSDGRPLLRIGARGSNPQIVTATEDLTLMLKGSLLTAAKANGLAVWYSNLSSSNELGVNPEESQVFQKMSKPLAVGPDGSIKLTVSRTDKSSCC